MGETSNEEKSRELPEGLFRPGPMTTTADPEMRERARQTIEKHRKRRDGEDTESGQNDD